ncbi:ORF6N domain-containing protein [Puniceicoccales bacterium CK1056]|uniref:ORF6N domain-containing protein n=1 Tax=Oceanipulchritudo coccoides TaxID=2706888 RepID=A0A6B2LXZ2_9BACT|nr:ORF6N domain-containing protein [Oceanipulchritudo coccoides]NDV61193.1 ORF6N domain-containing protein [Oceanipulchritudo coccoides]
MNKPIPIFLLRGRPVILDTDLATLYGVTTKRLNEQVRRNQERFPDDFVFILTKEETGFLKSQFATSKINSLFIKDLQSTGSGGRRNLPYAFTEHGALMAANVLKSPEAVKMSVFIIRAFVKQRVALSANEAILKRLAEIDKSLLVHDTALRDLYQKLLPLLEPPPTKPKRPLGFG